MNIISIQEETASPSLKEARFLRYYLEFMIRKL